MIDWQYQFKIKKSENINLFVNTSHDNSSNYMYGEFYLCFYKVALLCKSTLTFINKLFWAKLHNLILRHAVAHDSSKSLKWISDETSVNDELIELAVTSLLSVGLYQLKNMIKQNRKVHTDKVHVLISCSYVTNTPWHYTQIFSIYLCYVYKLKQ